MKVRLPSKHDFGFPISHALRGHGRLGSNLTEHSATPNVAPDWAAPDTYSTLYPPSQTIGSCARIAVFSGCEARSTFPLHEDSAGMDSPRMGAGDFSQHLNP